MTLDGYRQYKFIQKNNKQGSLKEQKIMKKIIFSIIVLVTAISTLFSATLSVWAK